MKVIVSLVIAFCGLFVFVGCDPNATTRQQAYEQAYQARLDAQMAEYERQQQENAADLERSRKQGDRFDALLDKYEEQARRADVLFSKQEEQAERFDRILDAWEQLRAKWQDSRGTP